MDYSLECLGTKGAKNIKDLLKEKVYSYNKGNSLSVKAEIADELVKSIIYTLSFSSDISLNEVLIAEDIGDMYNEGKEKIRFETLRGKGLYSYALRNRIYTGNISYNSTLKEIGKFFKNYNYLLFAHFIPCSIDYQLCFSVSNELEGIKYINAYLNNLIYENDVLKNFDIRKIKFLLEKHFEKSDELLINIFEMIMPNIILSQVIDKNIYSFEFNDYELERIKRIFLSCDALNGRNLLYFASKKVSGILNINNTNEKRYIEEFAFKLYPRIMVSIKENSLPNVLLSDI